MNTQNLNYLTDATGNNIAVQIPIGDWVLFQKEFEEIKRKFEVLQGLKDALREVRKAQKENIKLKSLTEFLND